VEVGFAVKAAAGPVLVAAGAAVPYEQKGQNMRKVDTYERLGNHLQAWHDHEIPFLVVVGRPGTGKSRAYEDLLADESYTLFRGRTSALQIYIMVYDHPSRQIVFDDVGQLLREPTCLELMKSLCDSRLRRIVQWNTTTQLLDGRDKCFVASSPVLVVCNRTLLDNEDMGAILDRGDAIEFDPPKPEVIAKLKTYADDPEIVALLEAMPVVPSLRTYEKAKAWKKSRHLDLKQELFAECGVGEHVQILTDIITNEPRERQLELYIHRTGRCRRDYFNQLPLARQLVTAAGDSLALLH
jgi:hypothetical protein